MTATLQYVIDGKPVSKARNSLQEIAWYYTAGIGGDDVKRVPLREFRPMLADLGVSDPTAPGWKVTLGNGRVLEAIRATAETSEQRQAARERAASEDTPVTSPKTPDGKSVSGEAVRKAAVSRATKAVKKTTPGQKAREAKVSPSLGRKPAAKEPAKKTPAKKTPAKKTATEKKAGGRQVTTHFKRGAAQSDPGTESLQALVP